jgi:hypothetical protein
MYSPTFEMVSKGRRGVKVLAHSCKLKVKDCRTRDDRCAGTMDEKGSIEKKPEELLWNEHSRTAWDPAGCDKGE